ncbi:prenyltransferase [Phycisphaerae bacterium RAS2]|nr:prenyltransferase [Phycisphaerae bacterium RAS2]
MSKLRAYAELVRLPNLFTAAADVLAGYWLYTRELSPTPVLAALAISSVCLYASAVALNAVVDAELDRTERPGRPIPSGRLTLHTARRCFAWLALLGLASAGAASILAQTPACIAFAGLIFFAGALYNLGVKHTPLRAANMATCRGLNLALGMSGHAAVAGLPLLAFFTFVAALTHFGRDEAGASSRSRLNGGAAGILIALLLLGYFAAERMMVDTAVLVLWLALAIHLGRVALRAVKRPDAATVQYAMGTFILAIIPFDAIMVCAAHGWRGGVPFAVLLLGAVIAGRWARPT